MNFRSVLYSGIMTALVGAMIGLALVNISRRELRAPQFIIVGAVVGFVLGSAFDAVRQQKDEDEDDA